MPVQTRQHLSAAAAAYRRFVERAGVADRGAPTRLAGWRIGDLVDHVAWGAAMEAAAVRRALEPEPADEPVRPAPSGSGLESAVGSFEQMSRLDVGPQLVVDLPAGSVPMAFAAPLFAFEAAVHDVDLAAALGAQAALRPEELAACEVVVGPMLDLLASPAPPGDVVIDLVGLGAGLRLRSDGERWHRSVPPTGRDAAAATTTITGAPQELVLFVAGRYDASVLDVVGDVEHAQAFKNYFPGP